MQMSQFIEALQADLRELAEIGGEELVQATQRLAGAIKQSATLRLIDALTQVALDLSSQLPNGHVEIRLAGQDPQLVYVVEEPSEPVVGDDGHGHEPEKAPHEVRFSTTDPTNRSSSSREPVFTKA